MNTIPKGVIGYAKNPSGGFMVRICAWCDTGKGATRWAAPLPVTHTLCPECYQKQMAQLLGERDLSCESQNNPIQPNHA